MDYPLCDRTVTLYRRERDGVTRQVLRGCYYQWEDHTSQDEQADRFHRKFLLVQPGENPIYPGDRIFDGEGPELSAQDWETFLPVQVPGLSQVRSARPLYFQAQLCHWEAR